MEKKCEAKFKSFAGCIFASLFFKSKGSTCEISKFFISLRKLFSFLKWIYLFEIFKFHDAIKCPSLRHGAILLNNLGSKNLVIKFGRFM